VTEVLTASALALVDRYRCPEAFVNFRLQDALSDDPGFFRFGSGITCYGRSSRTRARRPNFSVYDVSNDAKPQGSELLLPFDPTEIIDNLRQERYMSADSRIRRLAKEAYYALRPWLPDRIKRSVQRAHARDWR